MLDAREVPAVAGVGDDWARAVRATHPGDRVAAAGAIRAAYRTAGLPEPVVHWTGSPLAGLLAGVLLRHHPERLDPAVVDRSAGRVRTQLLELPMMELSTSIAARFRELGWVDDVGAGRWPGVPRWHRHEVELQARIAGGFDAQVRAEVARRVEADVLATATDGLRAIADPQLRYLLGPRAGDATARLRGRVAIQLENCFAAGRDAVAVAHLTHGLALLGMAPSARIDALADAVRETGWWWPLPGAVVASDRPTVLHEDHDRQLHRADGPALAYPDGFAVHSWHGTTVPAELVTGPGWSIERTLAEPNAEIRRCAIERTGWDRFAAAAELIAVSAAVPDPGNPGQLLRLFDLPDRLRDLYPRPARILLVTNASPDRDGTRRTFGLPVPADVPDALSAAAATFGVSTAEYAALSRAT